jgi:hypothetical protein
MLSLLWTVLSKAQVSQHKHCDFISEHIRTVPAPLFLLELAAFRLLLAPNGGSGLAIVKEAELQHHDNPEIVGNFCSLLSAMARYG